MLIAAIALPSRSRPSPNGWMPHTGQREAAVLDDVLIESVGRQVRFRAQQRELFARHEPHQRALARTQRTVEGHCTREFAFDLELHAAAVTAAFLDHGDHPDGAIMRRSSVRGPAGTGRRLPVPSGCRAAPARVPASWTGSVRATWRNRTGIPVRTCIPCAA